MSATNEIANSRKGIESLGAGRFHLRSRVGEGAVGVVYDALDRERDTRVALKALRTVCSEHILSLKNEFRAVQDLQHPNLVNLGELFEDGGQWFFTMEYVEGTNFLQYVSPIALSASVAPPASGARDVASPTSPMFDETRLRAALAQLVRGLSALHAAKKIHRDIKPSNILVSNEGRVVILDFGVASDLVQSARRIEDGMVGTVAYMAPEQAASEAVSAASDWYAVGALLYQSLTGQLPYSGDSHEILEQKVTREPPAPITRAPSVPRDLNDLCVDLLKMTPASRPSGPEILARLGVEADADEGAPASSATIFIGRRQEMRFLDEAFAETLRGTAVSVIVHGESGVGKSYLVRTFSERVTREHPSAVLFAGRCYERESVPYKAIDGVIDNLADYLGSQKPEAVAALLPDGAALLAQVFPVLADLPLMADAIASHGEIANPQELRLRVFAVLRQLLARIAARAPLVLVIDDLQWADADSLMLLAEVLRPPSAPPLLLLATQRGSTEMRRRAAASPATIAPPTPLPGDVRHLHVEQLPPADAEHLIVQLLGVGAANDADIRAIADETRGHPLFIDELVRQRFRQGAGAAPIRLDDALWGRVSRLDSRSRHLLELVSVAGVPIAQETAAHAAAVDLGQFFYMASVLRASHLARTTGVGRHDTIEAYHDRVRESVLAHLGASTRKDWHSRLAVALERSGQADPEALAIHWQGAENAPRAAEYAVLAGDQAARALAFDRAARLYQLALELAPPVSPAARSAHREVQTKLAEALSNAGRGAQAAETRLELARDAEPMQALDLRRRAAEQFLCSGHFDRGIVLLRAVLAAVDARFPQSRIAVLFWLLFARAILRLRGLSFVEHDAASIDPAVRVRLDALRSAGSGFSMSDNVLGAYFQTTTLLLALRAGDPARIVHALAMEVCFTCAQGERARAPTRKLLASAQTLAARVGTPEAAGMVATATGYAHYFVGEWKAAKECLDRGEETLRDKCLGVTFETNTTRAMLYRAICYLGALAELAERVPAVLRDAEQRGDIHSELNMRTTAVMLLGLAEDAPERVQVELARARQHLARSGFLVQHYFCLLGEAQLDLYRGEGEAAHGRMLAAWPALSRSMLLRIQVIRVIAIDQRARTAIMAARQVPARRDALLASAEADALRLSREGASWAAALGAMLLGSVADVRGDAEESASCFERATAALEAVDMPLHASAARRRRGELVGGAEGSALIATADAWSARQGIRDAARMARVFAPGSPTTR